MTPSLLRGDSPSYLRDELGVSPWAKTQAVYNHLLRA